MFEPEELMARIVDLEEQLKVSEMAPPAAEQLIACLEGEIAERDVEIERVTANCNSLDDQNDQLRAELSALKAQEPVAWPEGGSDAVEGAALGAFDSLGQPEHDLESWCAGYAEAVYAHAAPAAPVADAVMVLEQAMYALIGIGYHENSGLVHELRQSLAAHRSTGVV